MGTMGAMGAWENFMHFCRRTSPPLVQKWGEIGVERGGKKRDQRYTASRRIAVLAFRQCFLDYARNSFQEASDMPDGV